MTDNDTTNLTCELCFKSYQRRDLLIRHRRRCQGPSNPQTRRKACNACVQAKTKCCYSQPTCSRCAKRGQPCVYVSNSATDSSIMDSFEPSDGSTDTPTSDAQAATYQSGTFGATTEPLELPLLDSPMSLWTLDAFDMPLSNNGMTNLSFSKSTAVTGSHSRSLSLSSTSWNIPLSMSIAQPTNDITESSGFTPPLPPPPPPPSTSSLELAQLISKYPTYLVKDEITAPFLHQDLYNDTVPDMTSLPLTTTAICCGSSVNLKENARFISRAVDAERQRLIEAFPSYHCMQQWDALHAMLLYEILELRESLGDKLEAWKHKSKIRGLRSPFLLKSYPEILNPDLKVFSDPSSAPTSTISSPWARWKITETARRTIFFANIVNYYINHNSTTKQQLPYYEPLDNELILNMPLPCSHAAWVARDEQEWMNAIQTPPSPLALLGQDTLPGVSLKIILSKYTKDYVQRELGGTIGFGNSDQLRSLVILCASEQFT
ncbi:sequence-specific DNA binding RNA polymerase II transcription factor [Ascochyta rabiei]|uniref:Sequence-specific DNA binding RNA polymerase II transcription factor n=1 Tax=Didymella rabiei TaxID=5454 RepID=A0A163LG39_DIDRA|nr:sequence-specific DNA binding RNA polymerase II transcription factor [Ascochyta rabiei]